MADSVAFKKAIFRKHCIRDCYVYLHRLEDTSIPKKPGKKLIPKSTDSVRSQVSWIPTISTTELNSAPALENLSNYLTSEDHQKHPKRAVAKRVQPLLERFNCKD